MGSLEADRVRASLKSRLFGAASEPIRVGRFEILSKIGEGAMGVVYRARDPQLEREVAVKILRGEDASADRMLSEARAMARLEHPNVVGVYEAGISDDRAFVAMELVRGQSLAAWLTERRRPEEITRVMALAARGLDAAHRAGIVHRDFKPANVLVTKDGDPRVADFGLAGELRAAERDESGAPLSRTRTGGTPVYMAPEVVAGGRASAKSDQFAFGVSLFEALLGKRPFEAKTLGALREAHENGVVWPSSISRPQRRILERLLAADPERRFPSMGAVADALEPRAGRDLGWALALGLPIAASAAAIVLRPADATPAVCTDSELRIQEVWSPARRASVEEALAATGAPFARDAATRTIAAVDAYAGRWVSAHREACEATHVRKDQSAQAMDLRMACLGRRRGELDAYLSVLTTADLEVLEHAIDGAAALVPVERCANLAVLQRGEPEPPPDLAPRVEEVRRALAEARALREAGKYTETVEHAEEAAAAALAVGFAPTHAEALVELATAKLLAGDPKGARERALQAVDVAEASGVDEVGARGWLVVLSSAAKGAVKPEDTELFERRAQAAIARVGNPADLLGDLEEVLGIRRREDGKLDQALAHHERELALRIQTDGEGSLAVADAHAHIAGALTFLDRLTEGAAHIEGAIRDMEQVLGPDHPRLASLLNAHGLNLKNRGRYEEAYAAQSRGVALLERALGPETERLSSILSNLGNTCIHLRRLEEARKLHLRTIDLKVRFLGKDHPSVALGLNNLANVALEERKWDEAVELHRKALAIREKALPPGDRMIAMSLTNLGDALAGAGKYTEAIPHYERSIPLFEKAQGPHHSMLAYPLTGLGAALVETGRAKEAIVHLERALAIREKDALAKDLAAETRFVLARALVASKVDRARGMMLAAEARSVFASAGDTTAMRVKELDAWIAGQETAAVARSGLSGIGGDVKP